MVSKGHSATLVAATLAICRSSLYRRKKPRGSRADRTYDEQIVMACGEKRGVRLSTCGLVVAAEDRTASESEACVAGDGVFDMCERRSYNVTQRGSRSSRAVLYEKKSSDDRPPMP